MQDTRILIVDNNGVEAWDIEECLIDAGYVASSAHDGTSALRAAESAPPEIVLIDTHLKGSMETCDVVEALQQRYGCALIWLTTYWRDDLPTVTGQAAACVTKPFSERALLDAVAVAERFCREPAALHGVTRPRCRVTGIQRFTRLFPRVPALPLAGLSSRLWLGLLGIASMLALAGAACAAERPATELPPLASEASKNTRSADMVRGSFAPVVERVAPSVVSITAERVVRVPQGLRELPFFLDPSWREFFSRRFGGDDEIEAEQRQLGLGSGLAVTDSGHILTNHHVIDGARQIEVHLSDGSIYEAEVIGSDPQSDLAVLKIEASNLRALEFGNSDHVRVGDFVLAVGNPFGVGQTVTMGIVGATGRGGLGIEDYEDFIQTDAAINPGNSGGALIDLEGKLVGINTAIVARGGRGNQGVGFAVPINMAHRVATQILNQGKVSRGYIGVGIQPLTRALAERFEAPDGTEGALVGNVEPDGPADKAGIERGDIIRKVNGVNVADARGLKLRIGELEPGSSVPLEVWRGGSSRVLTVTLAERPSSSIAEAQLSEGRQDAMQGVEVEELTSSVAEQLGVGRNTKGVVITDVDSNSVAARAGLRVGDIIEEVEKRPVETVAAYRRAVRSVGAGPLLLLVNRNGNTSFVVVEPE